MLPNPLKKQVRGLFKAISITFGSLLMVTGVGATGVYQVLEFSVVDQFFRLRPIESADTRIAIVSVSEADIQTLRQWPLSDAQLAQVLRTISRAQPRAIGLDIYRDLPIEPGHADLEKAFTELSEVVGVHQVNGTVVNSPPVLRDQGRVAFADLALDFDNTIRRALLAIEQDGSTQFGLGTSLALRYLEKEGIQPVQVDPSGTIIQLGKATITPLSTNWGGYRRMNDRGYQIFLNFRGADGGFENISIVDVIEQRVDPSIFRDKLVLIGASAPSLNDLFRTPFKHNRFTDNSRTPGVVVHAQIASQLISAALENRPLIKSLPEGLEWAWSFFWIGLGTLVPIVTLQSSRGKTQFAIAKVIGYSSVLLSIQLISGYYLFTLGWWIPSIPALIGFVMASSMSLTAHNQELTEFAFIDGLTRIPNRRAFENYFQRSHQLGRPIGIILCDVDHFKGYNDTYGHQAGDVCLQQVAQALNSVIRRQDLAARYGGEEFVALLPDASEEVVFRVAERMRQQVASLKLEHQASSVCDHVTISCGAGSFVDYGQSTLKIFLQMTDKALYQAKKEGRNRVCLASALELNNAEKTIE